MNEFKPEIVLVGDVLAESLYHLVFLLSVFTSSSLWCTPVNFFITSMAISSFTSVFVAANAAHMFW